MSGREKINIIWLKKDLRLRDHLPWAEAIGEGLPVFPLFCFEPSLMSAPDSAIRHWRFAYESLSDLQEQLRRHKAELFYAQAEVVEVLEWLRSAYDIQSLFCFQEVGNKQTFDRDKSVRRYCVGQGIRYREFPQNGTIRGRKHREGWVEELEGAYFGASPVPVPLDRLCTVRPDASLRKRLAANPLPAAITNYSEGFQRGGETYAWRYLHSFLWDRAGQYSRHLSKPELSRYGCSRLSPYLAFGCISAREVFQLTRPAANPQIDAWHLRNFRSRLWWRSHYIQKLESEWRVEFEPINEIFSNLDRLDDGPLLDAWCAGRTGFPMVDASMRCLQANGWINFRMRAMLVTFASFALWLDWRPVALHLARLFLDYDPGIHYPQIQMQAGLTGYHTLRVFNPTVQVNRHDPEGRFIRKWIPELAEVPPSHLAEPWKMTPMEQQFYHCHIGKDYPAPVVDYDRTVAVNKDRYWHWRQHPETKKRLPAIWRKFCIPKDIAKYQTATDDRDNFGK